MSNLATIASAVKEGLELWKTFIATRQQAYERGQDKKMKKAIEYGERVCLRVNEIGVDDKRLSRLINIFFKYN